ncbi:hypothetical protein [Shimazuella kribbensis]|uniref:hypothetical protein n=1 Tax=Shimazuella kribbensis TaxID=139808 RepID=UPI00048EBEC4|nr:hypothetical protein [Shimazuella kribbensis]
MSVVHVKMPTQQKFTVFGEWKMYVNSSSIPLHSGQSDNGISLTVSSAQEGITPFSSENEEEICFTLGMDGAVEMGDNLHSYKAISKSTVRIRATEVKPDMK